MGFPAEVDALLTNAAALAQEEGIYLVLPTATMDPAGAEPFQNVVRIIDPNGEVVLEHYKYGARSLKALLPAAANCKRWKHPMAH